jgi:hypothetical protein
MKRIAVFVASSLIVASQAQAQLGGLVNPVVGHRFPAISFDLALDAAQTAIGACTTNSNSGTIEVFTPSRHLLVSLSLDEGSSDPFEHAQQAAYTLLQKEIPPGGPENPDRWLVRESALDPVVSNHDDSGIALALPIASGKTLLGVISGFDFGSSAKNQACLKAGLDKIKDRLSKPQP